MLGFLLARAGVSCIVLEKHADFLRDFRGDTIHPSTLEIMHELGILEAFLTRPHQRVSQLHGMIGTTEVTVADFSHLPTRSRFIALMPQWDFLDFLVGQGGKYPGFQVRMQSEAVGLLVENDRVVGVTAKTAEGPLEIRADLTVGADGRRSVIRKEAGLEVQTLGAPINVLWMRLSRKSDDPSQTAGRFAAGHILVMINRDTYWQCGYVVAKGAADDLRNKGLDAFRDEIAIVAPFLKDRLSELRTWDDVKVLTVAVDRLRCWTRPGMVCIGDAAHAMSPVGGVGINLAIQDAVAAANILSAPLREGRLTDSDVEKIQCRRAFPTAVTQWLQVQVQNRVLSRVLKRKTVLTPPLPLRLLGRWPWLRRIPARLVGLGIRPEHVKTPV